MLLTATVKTEALVAATCKFSPACTCLYWRHALPSQYNDNAFHNFWRAADVLHACYLLLEEIEEDCISAADRYTLLLAGARPFQPLRRHAPLKLH